MTTRFGRSLILLTALLALPAAAQAQIFYATPGGTGTTGTCDDAFGTIAEAIAAADALGGGVTEVRLAGDTFLESGLTVDFSELRLKGGYDPASFAAPCDDAAIEAARDPVAFETIIDAESNDRILDILPDVDDTMDPPVFIGPTLDVVVDGITFQNGLPMRGDPPGGSGGAMLILNSFDVQISNNQFLNNHSNGHFFNGGALYIAGYDVPEGSFRQAGVELVDNVFDGNSTDSAGNGVNSSGGGGAVAAFDFNIDGGAASPMTTVNAMGNAFTANTSYGSGDVGAALCPDVDGDGMGDPNQDCAPVDGTNDVCIVRAIGGAALLQNVFGTWDGNTFEGNRARARQTTFADASGQGGALFTTAFAPVATFGANPVITNNVFRNNTAKTGLGGYNNCGWFSGWGGAIYAFNFDTEMSGNVFDANTADASLQGNAQQGAWGGAVFVAPFGSVDEPPIFDNNTFTANTSIGGGTGLGAWGGGMFAGDFGMTLSNPRITNNLFDGNTVIGTTAGSAYGGGLQFNTAGAYPLLAKNTFVNNRAQGGELAGAISAIGGAARLQLPSEDTVIADNVVTENLASPAVGGAGPNITFAGMVLFNGRNLDRPDQRPLVQNNLVADNSGVGIHLLGFWSDQNDDGDAETGACPPTCPEYVFSSAELVNNTIVNNDGSGVLFNLSDQTRLVANVLWGNNAAGVPGVADLDDSWLVNDGDGMVAVPRDTMDVFFRNNIIESLPDFDWADAAADPSAGTISDDPLFVDPAAGDYHLSQPPDQAVTSPGVDAGDEGAAARTYETPFFGDWDVDGDGMADSLFERTTSTAGNPDIFFVDLGYHYDLGAPVADRDGDGIPDSIEEDPAFACLDPDDADTDDDGVLDGSDVGDDVDGDGTIAACDCDADGDGLTDGLESGVELGDLGPDTDTAATCDTSNAPPGCGDAASPTFTEDEDPTTMTDPLDPDTDGGGEFDGCEDVNRDGDFTVDERDPIGDDLDDDPDRDGIDSGSEISLFGTDPWDADTDDDGVSDFEEGAPEPPNDFLNDSTVATDCDTDDDGLPDGLERLQGPVPDPDGPDFPAVGTDVTATCADTGTLAFLMDGDGTKTTFAAVADTDDDGCLDGEEDENANGVVDPGETDPAVDDCVGAGIVLRISDAVTALSGGTVTCGPATTPGLETTVTTPCDMPVVGCSATPRLVSTRTESLTPMPGADDLVLPGEAAAGFEPAVLVTFELETCDETLFVRKDGIDLVLDTEP